MHDAAQARLLLQAIGWLVIGLTVRFPVALLLSFVFLSIELPGLINNSLAPRASYLYGFVGAIVIKIIGLLFFIAGIRLAFAKGWLFGVMVRSITR